MALKNKKSLGQHWLKNRAILDEIASLAAESSCQDLCIEIGPGLGTLTSSLFKFFRQVVAIEFDADLARKLPGQFPGKNLTVLNDDILRIDLANVLQMYCKCHTSAAQNAYSIAGNIPYYITSPIIHKLLELPIKPQKIVLLIQREVAERAAAEPGKMSLLALEVQNLAEATLGPVVKAAEFTPPPKVDSQVLILTPRPEPIIDPVCLKLAKIGFSSPRKKLVHNLAAGTDLARAEWLEKLEAADINPDARAEDLDLVDWEALA